MHSVELADKPPRTVFRPATCAVCQYPLRGVAERDGYVQCPECGMVAVPLTDDSIRSVLREAGRGGRRRLVWVMLAVLAGVAIAGAARALF